MKSLKSLIEGKELVGDVIQQVFESLHFDENHPKTIEVSVGNLRSEYAALDAIVQEKTVSPEIWGQAWAARQAIGWILSEGQLRNPLHSILTGSINPPFQESSLQPPKDCHE